MSAVGQYENMLSALNQADQGLDPSKVPPVLEDVLNEKTLAGKSALQGVSGVLVAKSATTAIKRLVGSKGSAARKSLKDAGIEDEDIDEVADAGAGGDLSELGTAALNVGVKALNRTLGNGFNYLKDAGQRFGGKVADTFKNNPASDELDDAGEALDISGDNPYSFNSLSKVFGSDETEAFSGKAPLPEGTEDPFSLPDAGDIFERATSSGRNLVGGLRGDSTIARATGPPEQELPDPAQSAADIRPVDPAGGDPAAAGGGKAPVESEINPADASDATEVTTGIKDAKDVEEAGKAIRDVKDAAEVTAETGAETFDPVELGIAAALGIAGTIASVFIKDHHTKNVAAKFTNEVIPVNYAAQLI